ncbi:MAG: flavin reductase [Bacteroidales bacterium]|nr:flavin reductase [Bacteroidales bacterium]
MHNEVNIFDFNIPVFQSIGKESYLLVSGTIEQFNCMTVGWSAIGYLWRKPMAFVFVRPQRYTFQFMEKYQYFSMNFFDSQFSNILELCGTKSGREINKMEIKELTPINYDNKTVYYNEAHTVFICKKVYSQDIQEKNFLETSFLNLYPNQDFHRIYYGEIEKIYQIK